MRGLVFISNEGDVLRFVRAGFHRALAARHELEFVLPSANGRPDFQLSSADAGDLPVHIAEVPPARRNAWTRLFSLSTFAFARRSETFRIRAVGLFRGWWPSAALLRDGWRGPIRYAWRALLFLRRQPRFLGYKLLSLGPVYRTVCARTIAALGPNRAIDALLADRRPDFVLVPSSLHDPFTPDVLQLAAAHGIRSILLQGNWDNISSKGVLFSYPDILAVWGEQARSEAVGVQGAAPDSIRIIGASQFESFRAAPDADRNTFLSALGLPVDRPMVVFAGNARGFDEVSALRRVEQAIDDGRIPPASIIYRPHPWTNKPCVGQFLQTTWRHTILDPETAAAHSTSDRAHQRTSNQNFYYSFNYLNTLYSHAAAMIVPYSTAILECMTKGVPVVTIAYSDDNSYWGPNVTSRMLHCQDLFGKPGIFRCDRESDLAAKVREALDWHRDPDCRRATREAARYFADFGEMPYGDRLVRIIEDALAETGPKSYP